MCCARYRNTGTQQLKGFPLQRRVAAAVGLPLVSSTTSCHTSRCLADLDEGGEAALNHTLTRSEPSGLQARGLVLLTIRDNRLYRATHNTFEDYCEQRWGLSGRRANQLIGAYEVTEELGTMVPKTPEIQAPNERQARELAPLRDQPEVIMVAVGGFLARYHLW